MSREMRVYLSCTAVTFGGLGLGTAWSLSGLPVNLLHLICGSLLIGYYYGRIMGALAFNDRYIYASFSPCCVCGKEILCRWPRDTMPRCVECSA